jgi:hypothetical protein
MGKRRDAAGETIAGKAAPAEFFRRVSNSANDMMEYRVARGRADKGIETTGGLVAESAKSSPVPIPPHRKFAEVKGSTSTRSQVPPREHVISQARPLLMWDREPWDDEEEMPGPW